MNVPSQVILVAIMTQLLVLVMLVMVLEANLVKDHLMMLIVMFSVL